eukprot:18530-Heterococcus_DN1.PRE.1
MLWRQHGQHFDELYALTAHPGVAAATAAATAATTAAASSVATQCRPECNQPAQRRVTCLQRLQCRKERPCQSYKCSY